MDDSRKDIKKNTYFNEIFSMISDLKLKPDVCRLMVSPDINLAKINKTEKKSKSKTYLFFAKYIDSTRKNFDTYMKVWLGDNGSLMYEKDMYEYISENIINTGICLNFIPFIAYGMCTYATINKFIKDNIANKKKKDTHILVTGSVVNIMSLFSLLNKKKDITKSEIKSIIFQLFYTLMIMENFEIIHNDLHFNNILVQILDKEVTLSFRIKSGEIRFTTKYLIKIFDWDMSYCPAVGLNPKLTKGNYALYNMNNEFRRNFDLINVICASKDYRNFFKYIKPLMKQPDFNFEQKIKNTEITINLTKYIKENPTSIKDFNKYENNAFVTIDKDTINTQYPEIKNLMSKERFDGFNTFYFEYVTDKGQIHLLSGGQYLCIVVHSDCNALYGLCEIFSNDRLLSILINGLNIVS